MDVSVLELILIAVAAVLTSILTAVAGAGGGITLLLIVLQFVEPAVAIPVIGVVQLLSNGTRAVSLRSDVEPASLRWFVIPLLPAAAVGLVVAGAVSSDVVAATIGVFALVAVWVPAATAWITPGGDVRRQFLGVGAIAGVATVVVGAPGPLLAPAFRAVTTSHVAFVATFAVVGALSHTAKLTVFAIDGFAFSDHLPLMVVAGAGVIIGTRIGTRLVRHLDPRIARRLFEAAVTLGATRLLLAALV